MRKQLPYSKLDVGRSMLNVRRFFTSNLPHFSTLELSNFRTSPYFSLLTSLFLLSGCTLGPDYKKPEVAEPKEFLATGSTNRTEQLVQWWQKLNDPVLSGLVSAGLINNLTIQTGLQRVRQSRAQMLQMKAGLWPSLTGAANYNYGRKLGNQAGVGYSATGSGIGGEWGGTFAAGFDATWELDIFGGTRREIEAREAELVAMHYTQRDINVSVAAEIAMAYLNVRMFQSIIDVTQSNLVTQTQSAQITRKRHQAKAVSGLDLANAEAQVLSTTALIPSLQSGLANGILQLELLLGDVPNARKAQLVSSATFPALPAALPSMLPNELLRRRPDVRKVEEAVKAATARIGVAEAELYPRFALIGSIGASLPTTGLDRWSMLTESVRVGPRVSWNIFSAGRIRAQVEERKAQTEQAVLAYQQVVLKAYNEAESAWQTYNQEASRGDTLQRAVEANQRAVHIAGELFKAGSTDYTEVLIAQRALLAAQDTQMRHRALLAQKVVTFYKALGGGEE
jgi:NodT family efflux transporter outer membrane factor (OMF) lipoprotein